MTNRNALRRLRILQKLSLAGGEWLGAPMVLRMLRDDVDLKPDLVKVLRSLIWLEDHNLAEVRTVDLDDDAVVFARISAEGLAYLNSDELIEGILHPSECLEVSGGS